jgi:hypothetical protein
MKILNLKDLGGSLKRCSAILCIGLTAVALSAFGQPLQKAGDPQNADGITSVKYIANGTGIMVAGQLWDSFMPANRGPYYSEASNQLVQDAIRIGNFDRLWSTPTHMWPGGYDHGNFWNKDIWIATFDPDPTYNPATIGGATNPAYVGVDGPNYALAAYANKPSLSPKRVVLGAGDPTRDYYQETQWVDAQKRHHAVYKAGFPTTAGIDVKMEVHQYSLHWNSFNDFIIVKITLKNTGKTDFNADGVAEKTNHRIPAVALLTHGEFMCSYQLNTGAGRINRFGAQRVQAYIGDPDPKGNPWDMAVGFPGESATGVQDMGLNDFPNRFYTDIWGGFTWLGAKDSVGNDKQTIFKTHPVGAGKERGYYTASGMGRGLSFGLNQPKGTFVAATGEWYVDGGKSRSSNALNLAPNSNFFASGSLGDVTTFVPKSSGATRPNGDRKLLSLETGAAAFEVNPYEPGFTIGYSGPSNFDGDYYKGIGPFSLEVGESITITYVEVAGYRLAGILNALAAARYVYENGDAALDNYPAVPDMRVDFIAPGTPVVRWDNRAESDPNFAGYKLYRASAAIPLNYTNTGMRVLDDYWKNMTPGPTPDNLKKDVNPNFKAFDFIANKIGAPDSWGPYDLVTVIPKSDLSKYANSSTAGYNYVYTDVQAPIGLKFWYYLAAYTSTPMTLNSSYSGLNSPTTSFLETSNVNRNGASGMWINTYPFAFLNADYPKPTDAVGLKNIGTGVSVDHYPAALSDLLSGALKVSVKPNPYKKRAMFDNITDASDHKVLFYNLPPQAKITILDVSGQIVQILNFTSSGPSNGTMYWNLFAKTGMEVASGLYIYVVEYAGGQQVGYLSIMR